MTTTTVKSTSITNLDATPVTNGANTTGAGAVSYSKRVMDSATMAITTGANTTILRLVRIPMTALVKHVNFESAALTKGSVTIGLAYSDSTIDGTPAAVQGNVINASFFANSFSCASAVGITDKTNASGGYPANKRNLPICIAAGVATADWSGFLDVIVQSVASVTATGLQAIECSFDL